MTSVELSLCDEKELLALTAQIAEKIKPGLVIYLKGNLGVGKTVFARGLINHLGYEGLVKSPTYSLVEPYQLDDTFTCYHFDLYRLSEPEELEFTGSRDYFNEQSVCLVEWPEKAEGFIPVADIVCELEYHEIGRKITIYACSDKGDEVMLQCFPN
jgi:tRNA threonylcarbamoyladenosine biosynthesis protein TsaE